MAEILKCIVCVCVCEVFSWNAFVNADLYVQYQPILVSCSDPPVYLYNVRACHAALANLGSLANERVVFTQIMNCAQRVASLLATVARRAVTVAVAAAFCPD